MKPINLIKIFLIFLSLNLPLYLHAGVPEEQTPPSITTRPEFHMVVDGDTLWDISKTYNGNPFLWREIWNLNKETIENPNLIYPNQKVFLTEQKKEKLPVPVDAPPKETVRKIQEEPPVEIKPAEQKPVEIGLVVSFNKRNERTGKVTSSIAGKNLLEPGDEITIKLRKLKNLEIGTMLVIHRKRELLINSDGEFSDEEDGNIVTEPIGVVELKEIKDSRTGIAKIVTITGPIEVGDSLKVWE